MKRQPDRDPAPSGKDLDSSRFWRAHWAIRKIGPDCRKVGPWRLNVGGMSGSIRRKRTETEDQCPLTAVCHVRGLGTFLPEEWEKAAVMLGIDREVAELIIHASDANAPYYGALRRRLKKELGL